jgi:hypothetical protein
MTEDVDRAAAAYAPDLTLPLFYLGTHRPGWLWDATLNVPLMVSDRWLREYAALHPATVPEWALDSGAFTELSGHAAWTTDARTYCERVARYDQEIGGLAWAGPQDWMCEPEIIRGGRVSPTVVAPGTGLSVAEHQRRTVASYLELTGMWPQFSDAEAPFIPVLQGYAPGDYEACHALYEAAGVDLAAVPLTGIGSVCRRSSAAEIRDVVSVVGGMSLVSHWFGVKLAGVRLAGLRTGAEVTPSGLLECGPGSLDSLAWSMDARYGERLPDCTHKAAKCGGCREYALRYREKVLEALLAARDPGPGLAAGWRQGALFAA